MLRINGISVRSEVVPDRCLAKNRADGEKYAYSCFAKTLRQRHAPGEES